MNVKSPFAGATGADTAAPSLQDLDLNPLPAIALSNENLPQIALLRAGEVAVPAYDRSEVKIGHVHIGASYFFRSLIAPAMDEVMATGDLNWGIATINVRGKETKQLLDAQDGLYTLIERNGDTHARVIGSIMESHTACESPEAYEAAITRMADPNTKLITMTITEGGYKDQGGEPAPAVKLIVDSLQRRHETGAPAPTVMSCDNMPDNGKKLKAAVLSHAEQISSELKIWIENTVKFPSTMVDRITPSTDADKASNPNTVKNDYNLVDPCAVVTESYRCWVIEDNFNSETDIPPALRKVSGVFMTNDPVPLELTKIRALNGAHVAIGIIGHLTGHVLARDAMRDPEIREFVGRFIDSSLQSLPDHIKVEESAYGRDVTMSRIGNEHMKDSLVRLPRNCSDGKIQNRVLASAKDLLASSKDFSHHAFVTAAWFEYLKGKDSQGMDFDISDPKAIQKGFQEQMRINPKSVQALLGNSDVFDYGVRTNQTFREEVKRYYNDINTLGMKAALAKFNEEHRDSTLEAKPDISAGKPEFRM